MHVQPDLVKDIYLIRHGETEYNRKGVVQGSGIDADLNDLGQKQAAAFFAHYQDLPIDKIYTSVLRRTHQSVKGFIEKGLPWEQHTGLNAHMDSLISCDIADSTTGPGN